MQKESASKMKLSTMMNDKAIRKINDFIVLFITEKGIEQRLLGHHIPEK